MRRHWQYLKYVLKHKYYVYKAGRKVKLPLYLCLLHDWSKFLPSEWFPYARTFYKPDGTKQFNKTDEFYVACNYHYKRNKHHWQYWMYTPDSETTCLLMPVKYLYEMVADWRGASMAITGSDNTTEWYMKNRNNIQLHPYIRWTVERWFEIEDMHPDAVKYNEKLWKEIVDEPYG